jgi:hypothetical protein
MHQLKNTGEFHKTNVMEIVFVKKKYQNASDRNL